MSYSKLSALVAGELGEARCRVRMVVVEIVVVNAAGGGSPSGNVSTPGEMKWWKWSVARAWDNVSFHRTS